MTLTKSEDRSEMSFRELVSWAWRETPPVHTNAKNLLIHLFAVPLFVFGNLLVVAGLVFNPWILGAGVVCVVASLALQKVGHAMEPVQVHPFTGPRDFLRRVYAEQFCNYWRFLFSGQWHASLKASRRRA